MRVGRRQYWAKPDRPRALMPCADPLWLVNAPLELAGLTGVDVRHIPASKVSVFCIPVAEADWTRRGMRRWPGTRPEAMWHPLLWLPATLRAPLVAVTEDGERTEEPLEMWQARVAFEIIDAGLYTADGWLDVLSLVDIDVDRPADVERVRRWLDGVPDSTLDNLGLDTWFADDTCASGSTLDNLSLNTWFADDTRAPDRPHTAEADTAGAVAAGTETAGADTAVWAASGWSAGLAADVTPLLTVGATALMADALLSLAYELAGYGGQMLTDDELAASCWWLGSLAIEAVADRSTLDTWMSIMDDIETAGTERQALLAAANPAAELLLAVRDAAWPALRELNDFQADIADNRGADPSIGPWSGEPSEVPESRGPGSAASSAVPDRPHVGLGLGNGFDAPEDPDRSDPQGAAAPILVKPILAESSTSAGAGSSSPAAHAGRSSPRHRRPQARW